MKTYFSEDYAAARVNFVTAAAEAGCAIASYNYPVPGLHGEDLYVDVAFGGDRRAARALLLVSGTHGVEGFCGSASQVGWLRENAIRMRNAGVSIIFVHALNPYGFSFLRRVTHENVDLNRNFLPFGEAPFPENSAYKQLSPFVNPTELTADTLDAPHPDLSARLTSPEAIRDFKKAVASGQYESPRGIIYGGRYATWSNLTMTKIIAKLPARLRQIALVDIHTGLGDFGTMEAFCEEPIDSSEFLILQSWFTGAKLTSLGDSESLGYRIDGSLYRGVLRANPKIEWFRAALEFGTEPLLKVLCALVADNWLHCRATEKGPIAEHIRSMMRKAFYPETELWREAVYSISRRTINQAIEGLQAL